MQHLNTYCICFLCSSSKKDMVILSCPRQPPGEVTLHLRSVGPCSFTAEEALRVARSRRGAWEIIRHVQDIQIIGIGQINLLEHGNIQDVFAKNILYIYIISSGNMRLIMDLEEEYKWGITNNRQSGRMRI